MQTDEVIFGGVGAGLYGMLLYAIMGVFIAGLMVGRTPEYIGKKIQQKEVKMALFAVLATAFLHSGVLRASASSLPFAKGGYWNPPGPAIANLNNAGPHGLSEMLYAYTSASENNGSAFAGITVNTPWYDLTLGLAMLFGRFLFMIPALAAAGSLASKKRVPDIGRHAADARPAVRRPAGGDGDRGRRADVLPGAVARPDCRALPDAPGQAVLDDVRVVPDLELSHGHYDRYCHRLRLRSRRRRWTKRALMPKKLVRARPLFDPEILAPRAEGFGR